MPCFTQAMINLLLTGRAVPNVFNGDIEYHKNGRKMVGYFFIYFVIGQLEVALQTGSVCVGLHHGTVLWYANLDQVSCATKGPIAFQEQSYTVVQSDANRTSVDANL